MEDKKTIKTSLIDKSSAVSISLVLSFVVCAVFLGKMIKTVDSNEVRIEKNIAQIELIKAQLMPMASDIAVIKNAVLK